jgi:hypothetical protein
LILRRQARRRTIACRHLKTRPRLLAQSLNDFRSVRESVFVVLGKNQNTISSNIEDAAATLDEVGLHSEFLKNFGRQTGGVRQIISTYAIFDRDMHHGLLS